MRVWCSGNTSPFQGDFSGSNPLTRSTDSLGNTDLTSDSRWLKCAAIISVDARFGIVVTDSPNELNSVRKCQTITFQKRA
jgi:hypothetical protein